MNARCAHCYHPIADPDRGCAACGPYKAVPVANGWQLTRWAAAALFAAAPVLILLARGCARAALAS